MRNGAAGTLRDSVDRCPLPECPGRGFRGEPFLTCAGFLGPPDGKGLRVEGCDVRGGAGAVATFLNVILHSISSPAQTVCSFHWTKTLMVDGGGDCEVDIMSWRR